MTVISYAQNGEDIVLWRALGSVQSGFYIDIGACDPSDLSVTKLFYDRGWNGINVEPVGDGYERFLIERPRDLNLNVAVAARSGLVSFKTVGKTGLSTIVDSVADLARAAGFSVEASQAPALTLADICKDAAVKDIHFLKIDVEGAEREVLEGADFERFRPWVVVIEATVPNSPARNDHLWRGLLESAGYECVLFDGLNLFFVAREHENLRGALSIPANVHDGFTPARHYAAEQRNARLSEEFAEQARRGAEAMARLESEYAKLEAERDDERQAAAEMQFRLDQLWLEKKALESYLKQAEEDSAQLRLSLDQQRARELATVERLNRKLVTDLASKITAWRSGWAQGQTELHSRLAAETAYRDVLLGSTSWRVTRPLRGLGALVHMIRREPTRISALAMARLRSVGRRRSADGLTASMRLASLSVVAADAPATTAPDALARAASEIDDELTLVSELLETVSSIIEPQEGSSLALNARPGSDRYLSMSLNQQLAAWIRNDIVRQRRDARKWPSRGAA